MSLSSRHHRVCSFCPLERPDLETSISLNPQDQCSVFRYRLRETEIWCFPPSSSSSSAMIKNSVCRKAIDSTPDSASIREYSPLHARMGGLLRKSTAKPWADYAIPLVVDKVSKSTGLATIMVATNHCETFTMMQALLSAPRRGGEFCSAWRS